MLLALNLSLRGKPDDMRKDTIPELSCQWMNISQKLCLVGLAIIAGQGMDTLHKTSYYESVGNFIVAMVP